MTDAERLDLLAVLLARKRDEAMGRAARTAFNHETMLVLAVAPAGVVDEILAANQDWLDALGVPTSRAALWANLLRDIRSFFPPAAWPAWLPAGDVTEE